jgi:hypothetical protein
MIDLTDAKKLVTVYGTFPAPLMALYYLPDGCYANAWFDKSGRIEKTEYVPNKTAERMLMQFHSKSGTSNRRRPH